MKICCSQEYYDKVVQYAKSINDKTLENCLELFVRILRTLSGRKYRHCRRTVVSWKSGRVLCRHHGTFPRMEHTYIDPKFYNN